jgi:hypothetical protein
MAWNPSPEVQVARDVAAKLGHLAKSRVTQVVITYVTPDGRLGSVTYGADKSLCDTAQVLGDALYAHTMKLMA